MKELSEPQKTVLKIISEKTVTDDNGQLVEGAAHWTSVKGLKNQVNSLVKRYLVEKLIFESIGAVYKITALGIKQLKKLKK